MSSNQSVTFVKKTLETFPLTIELAIPPENPQMKGKITVHYIALTREQVTDLSEDKNLSDGDYLDRIVARVEGFGNDAGTPITGADAINEVKEGPLSMWILPAVVQAYFEQYNLARQKNSKTSRRG